MGFVDEIIYLLGGVPSAQHRKMNDEWQDLASLQDSTLASLYRQIATMAESSAGPTEKAARASATHNLRPVLARLLLTSSSCTAAELIAETGATKKAVLDTLARMERAGLVLGDELQYSLTVQGANYARKAVGRPDAKHVHMPKPAAAEVTR